MHQSLGHVIIYIDWVMGKVLESRKNKRISFANDMLGGMYYSGVKANMKKCSHKEYKVVD